jgi:phage terminase small subunit
MSETTTMTLNPQRRAFIREYILDLNGTLAAIRAGYSPDSASMTAADLLCVPAIREAIDAAMKQRAERLDITSAKVLAEMTLLAQSDLSNYRLDDDGNVVLADGAPEGAMRAIQSIRRRKTVRTEKDGAVTVSYDVDIRLWDKVLPLKLVGRHIGLFPDRVEHSGPAGKPIEIIHKIERVIITATDPRRQLTEAK